jgi:hypothetical protein
MSSTPSKSATKRSAAEKENSEPLKKSRVDAGDLEESEDMELSRIVDEEEENNAKEQIIKIDPEKTLSIHEFLEYYRSDCLIREYLNICIELNALPFIPDEETLQKNLTFATDVSLPTEIYKEILNNYISSLQIRYFYNQTKDATASGVSLFNPSMNFYFPQFALYPSQVFKNITDIKQAFVIHIQKQAYDGSRFPFELLLLRNMKLIRNQLVQQQVPPDDLESVQKYFIAMTYLKAKMEIVREYNVKIIDWDSRNNKVKHTQPTWRTDSPNEVPETRPNFYAENIKKRLDDGKEIMQGTKTADDFKEFIQASKSIISSAKNSKKPQNNKRKKNKNSNKNYGKSGSTPPPPPSPPSPKSSTPVQSVELRGNDDRKILKSKRRNKNVKNSKKSSENTSGSQLQQELLTRFD